MSEQRVLNTLKIFEPLMAMVLWGTIYALRVTKMRGEPVNWSELAPTLVVVGFLTALTFWKWDLYRDDRFVGWQKRLFALLKANSMVFVFFVVVLYFTGERRFSRLSILLYGAVSTIAFIFLRGLAESYFVRIARRGIDLKSIVFCGTDEVFLQLHKALIDTPGWLIKGWIADGGLASKVNVKSISESDIRTLSVNETIVVSFKVEDSHTTERFVNLLDQLGFNVKLIPALRSRVLGLTFDNFFGLPMLTLNAPEISSTGMFLKRILDLFGSIFGLVVLSPFLLFLAIMTKISSPGPIFYSQFRIGMDGKKFKLFKFRTMRVGADKQSQWTVAGDPRTTRIGAIMRKTSMDELPQLWNIFRGEMSLVGPRPEQPNFVEEFKKEIPNYMLRHRMKAGLTGWAQVHGFRGDTDLTKRLDYDLEYIRIWSIWLDLKIILLTLYKGIFNKNAY